LFLVVIQQTTSQNRTKQILSEMIKANELRIGNYFCLNTIDENCQPVKIFTQANSMFIRDCEHYGEKWTGEPIPLSEDILLRLGYSIIHSSSAGNAWGFVINGVFSSDLKIIQWKTIERAGKFYRSELELKGLHHLQNIHSDLTGTELTLNP